MATFCMDSRQHGVLELSKHKFTELELLEMSLRLFGFTRKPKDVLDIKNNLTENLKDDNIFEDFETSINFDFSWLESEYRIIDISKDTDTIDLLKLKFQEYQEQKSNSNSEKKILKDLADAAEGAVKACPIKATEINAVFQEYSKGELLQQLVKEGMNPKDPKPAFKGLMEKLKTIKESAKAEAQATPEAVQSDNATNSDTQQEAKNTEEEVNILSQVAVEHEVPLNELPIIQFTQPLINPVVNNTTQPQQPCVPLHVINFVNVYTLPPSVTDQEKQQILDTLGRAFAKQDFINYILQRQNRPLFNIVNVTPNEILLQSIQPGCHLLEVRLAGNEIFVK